MEVGTELTVKRERGLKLIKSGVARLVCDDDEIPEEIAKLTAMIAKRDKEIAKLNAKVIEVSKGTEPIFIEPEPAKKGKRS